MNSLSILILDGTNPLSSVSQRLIEQSRLVVCTHPKKRGLFTILKARVLPGDWREERVLGNITRKTLDKLITANL